MTGGRGDFHAPFGEDVRAQLDRLLALRSQLDAERLAAVSPAVSHAVRLAIVYLQIAVGACGHTDDLCPEELWEHEAMMHARQPR